MPGSQQGPHGTPHSPGLCLETPHCSSTTQPCQASTIPVSAGATHPRGFQCYGESLVPSQYHPTHLRLRVHLRLPVLCPGDCKQGTVSRVLVQRVLPRTTLQHQGDAVPKAGCPGTACRWVPGARASRRKPGSRREPAQPEGLGVCRARCVLGSPGSTYPAPVPTQWGAGRPAGARARSARTAPRFSPPRLPAQPLTQGAAEGSGWD